MRSSNQLIIFLSGIVLLLIAVVIFIYNGQTLGNIIPDVLLEISIVVLSLVIIDRIWSAIGGDPLQHQIEELKSLNDLSHDGNRCGLIRIHEKVTEIDGREWTRLFRSAESNIDISSNTLADLIARPDLWNLLLEKAKRGIKVRLLFNSIQNPAAVYAGYDHVNTMRDQITEFSQKYFETLEQLTPEIRKNFIAVQLHNETMFSAIRRFDETMYVVHYEYSTRIRVLPVYVFEGSNKPLFQLYLNEFEKLFENNLSWSNVAVD